MSSDEGHQSSSAQDGDYQDDVERGVKTVGLAMSGGGYRATAWGIGTAMAIADLGAVPFGLGVNGHDGTGDARSGEPIPLEIRAISSVSGGSIANTWLGLTGSGVEPLDSARLDAAGRDLLPKLVGRKRWWHIGLLSLVAISIITPWFLRDAIPNDGLRYMVTSGAAVLLATVLGSRAGDLLFGWWAAWVYFGGLIVGLVGVGWIMFLPRGMAYRLALALIALLVIGIVAQFRPYIVQAALARQFARLGSASKPRAVDLGGHVQHTICITELEGNNLLYAGSGLVYSSNFGLATEAPLTAASATQASANFPGGFPIRWLSGRNLALTPSAGSRSRPGLKRLAVTDGGAYDNMGGHWFTGLAKRRSAIAKKHPDLGPVKALDPPDLVCIANASGLSGISSPVLGAVPLLGEVLGLLRVKTVLYEQTTAPRRTELIARFIDDNDSLNGVLSHILTSPEKTLEQEGATDISAALKTQDPTIDWKARAEQNGKVPTALWPLGDAIVDLVHHAYVLTAVHFHVYHNRPIRLPPRSEFEALVANGAARPTSEHWHPAAAASNAEGLSPAGEH